MRAGLVLRCEGAERVSAELVASDGESPAELAVKVLERAAVLLWEASAATSTTSTSASAAAAAAAAGGETGGVDALLDDFRPILMELAVNLLGRGAASSTPAAAAADAARVLHVVSRAALAVL